MTAKIVRFLDQVFEHGNGTEAYIQHIARPGTDRGTAGPAAWKLLRRPEVRLYLREVQQYALAALQVTINRIIAGVASIAFADRTALFASDGSILPPSRWPYDVREAIDCVEMEEIYGLGEDEAGEIARVLKSRKFKVRAGGAKLKALELLMRFKGMLTGHGGDAAKRKHESLIVEICRGNETSAPE